MSVTQQANVAIEPDADLSAPYMRAERRPCFMGIHAWHWVNEALSFDMGERECLRCGKRQVVSMDAH